jgi:hypothetical protein
MKCRFTYAGAAGLLLTLACGSKVEIGHGEPGGAGGTGGAMTVETGGSVASAGKPGSEGGEPAEVPAAGSSASGPVFGGLPPADNGPQRESRRVDLLLAIDNSISMAEKSQLFAKTVPELVKRLVNPYCVSTNGVEAMPDAPDAPCPAGSQREFAPLTDLHVGVITSSLGSHGASGAKDVCVGSQYDDHAHLLPFVRDGLASYNNKGFLKWDPQGLANPPGESDVQAFADSLQAMITSVGEHGCGYEAQLESVYRFLVDPEPPQSVEVPTGQSVAQLVGIDQELLEQRASFLRPDSSVVVLMLTDENDCSIVDEGYGWLIPHATPMYRSTSACLADPNDACCQSCAESRENPGCPSIRDDSECQQGNTLPLGADEMNLRCYNQKGRFGFDLLHPTSRYVSGFGAGTVLSRDLVTLVPNPLFVRDGVVRDPSLFTLAVVGGVPWQDLATDESLAGQPLQYRTAAELASRGRWPLILGDASSNTPPLDPFMRESTDERSGKNPITQDPVVPSTSMDPQANSINGHEQANVGDRDLQYACTFELPEPVVCDQAAFDADRGCDCFAEDSVFNRPLCTPPGGGAQGTTQYYGKAYPALRELDVAHHLGRRTVLGSVCAPNTQDETRSDYGYRPVFGALGQRIAATLVKQ